VKAINARFAHVRRRGPSQVVRAEVERQAAVAEHGRGLLRTVGHAGGAVIGEDVALIAVLGLRTSLENLQHHRRERHPVRIGVLGGFRRDRPPPGDQIDILPPHRADLAAALRRQQHHDQHVVQRLRESRFGRAVGVLRLGLHEALPLYAAVERAAMKTGDRRTTLYAKAGRLRGQMQTLPLPEISERVTRARGRSESPAGEGAQAADGGRSFGSNAAIVVDPRTGVLSAGADPRVEADAWAR
jgi:hypothetical protein